MYVSVSMIASMLFLLLPLFLVCLVSSYYYYCSYHMLVDSFRNVGTEPSARLFDYMYPHELLEFVELLPSSITL